MLLAARTERCRKGYTRGMKPLLALLFCFASGVALAQPPKETAMHATGTFEVKVKPQQADNPDAQAAGSMRLSLDKAFVGALQGESHGEMLGVGDGKTAGGYVAVEKFSGTLDGKAGSFALVHRALMRDGKPEQWSILVAPGSGTGELAGIDGAMSIVIDNGVHHYTFDYTLPAAK